MQVEFAALEALGAGEFAHFNGTLLAHLQGTESLLGHWGARPALARAGLFHAAYGTAGFDTALAPLTQRREIAAIVGDEAEAIIYRYCACDRQLVWPQFGRTPLPRFRDRFSGEESVLDPQSLRDFCELTVANELQLAQHSAAFVEQHGADLLALFKRMEPFLSQAAAQAVDSILNRGG